jgi:endonuclease G
MRGSFCSLWPRIFCSIALVACVFTPLANAQTEFTQSVFLTGSPAEHLVMGNPSNAVADVNTPLNYLIPRDQYVLSYNRDKATPNWVAWHLESPWIGSTPRQDDYRPDTSLPAGWYQVQATDYSGSGFDRGHMCPSGDRTSSVADNSATFLMTNFIPQAPNNNQGPYELLESYCRTLASQGNELYIYTGPWGQGGSGSNGGTTMTVANGNVVVPSQVWKVILVLPIGTNDVDRVGKTTRTIAVIMPNTQSIGINTPWQNFRVSVRKVEQMTGLDFFTSVPPVVRRFLKLRVDRQ